jgi:hypothetical protein
LPTSRCSDSFISMIPNLCKYKRIRDEERAMRRQLCATVCFLVFYSLTAAAEPEVKTRRIVFQVSETAGIRRFGYPVNVILPLPEPVKSINDFRLLSGDKPVSAQFNTHGDTSKGIRSISLDFNASPGPLKREEYVVEYGSGVPTLRPKLGLRLETTEKEFRVIHPSGLQFAVSREFPGVIEQVQAGKTKYLNGLSQGLSIGTKANKRLYLGQSGKTKPASSVVREGPLAIALRFEISESPGSTGQVASIVEMEFPISKSWVRVNWIVDDPGGDIVDLSAGPNLHLEGEPVLFDFGAGTAVYGQLRRGESARLRQNAVARAASVPRWETLLGTMPDLKPYVLSPGSSTPPERDAEGWAHIMDRERCTAVAIAEFATSKEGAEITVNADGRLELLRKFGLPPGGSERGTKRLTYWLHFVGMPVHVGAATSPQAMLAPLQVEIVKKP